MSNERICGNCFWFEPRVMDEHSNNKVLDFYNMIIKDPLEDSSWQEATLRLRERTKSTGLILGNITCRRPEIPGASFYSCTNPKAFVEIPRDL